MADKIGVRLLRPSDDRSEFESGNIDLDRFFRQYAGQNQFRNHVGATYVSHDSDNVLGFATVAAGHIEIDGLPKSKKRTLPRYPLPILRLARSFCTRSSPWCGLCRRNARRGLGRMLLRACGRGTWRPDAV